MKLFISWSGKASNKVASALHKLIKDTIKAAEPWMSEMDIPPGDRWSNELSNQLSGTKYGIICLTQTNLNAPWILFEAGALSKTIEKTFVCPYLINLEPSQISQSPLAQFQAKRANRRETWELICAINQTLKTAALADDELQNAFDQGWTNMESALDSLPVEERLIEAERLKRSANYDTFCNLGMDMVHKQLSHENLQEHLKAARNIRVLKTWFPENHEIEEGLEEAIMNERHNTEVSLLLCKPSSALLQQRSYGAGKSPQEGPRKVYRTVHNVHRWIQANPSAKVEIALYDSWPGCPVIWYDKTILMGFYFRGAPSTEWPWVSILRKSKLAYILEKQFTKLWELDDTQHLKTPEEMARWLKENEDWKDGLSLRFRRAGKPKARC